MVPNFLVDNWAIALIVLIWANLIGILAQVDIPNEVWGQYPLILVGVVLVGWLARYYVSNERDWREFVVSQLAEREQAHLRIIQLVQSNNEQLIVTIERNHQEQLKIQRAGMRETFESELDRVLDLLAKAGHYESQPRKTTDDDKR